MFVPTHFLQMKFSVVLQKGVILALGFLLLHFQLLQFLMYYLQIYPDQLVVVVRRRLRFFF